MKNKKIIMYMAIILLILFILGIGFLIVNSNKKNNNNKIQDYIPAEEITDEQFRQTNIILYFLDNNTGEITTEIKQIDSKILLEKPENKLIQFLINGPDEEHLTRLIPENTKLISTELTNGILNINFSEEFLENQDSNEDIQNKVKKSILETVKQLNEINEVKILINGEEF